MHNHVQIITNSINLVPRAKCPNFRGMLTFNIAYSTLCILFLRSGNGLATVSCSLVEAYTYMGESVDEETVDSLRAVGSKRHV